MSSGRIPRRHAGREGYRGATAAAAAAAIPRMRISRMAEHGIEGVGSGAEFRGIGLAQRYGAGPLAALDDQRVAFRHVASPGHHRVKLSNRRRHEDTTAHVSSAVYYGDGATARRRREATCD